MVINVKIILDPKFYYQKLNELGAKSKQVFSAVGGDVKKVFSRVGNDAKKVFSAVGSDVKKVFSAVRSGVSGVKVSFTKFAKTALIGGGGALILIEGFKSRVEMGTHYRHSRIQRMKEAATSDQNFSRIPETA